MINKLQSHLFCFAEYSKNELQNGIFYLDGTLHFGMDFGMDFGLSRFGLWTFKVCTLDFQGLDFDLLIL